MRLLRSLRLQDVLVLGLFPATVVVWLVASAAFRYDRLTQFDDPSVLPVNLRSEFSAGLRSLLRLPRRLTTGGRLTPNDGPAGPSLSLEVERRPWAILHGDPQEGWDGWVDAVLHGKDQDLPVKLRKRGDNSVHWVSVKRSLTVRTPTNNLFKGLRQFALSSKEVVPAYLANSLTHEFGLLAPDTELAPVFVNGRFHGLFRLVELVDESFLRGHGRMPGKIFRGDRAERGDYLKGVPRSLFENPALWELVGADDQPPAEDHGQLADLVRELNEGTFESHTALMRRINREEFARLMACLLVVGDPFHMSGVHNQLVFEDPSDQLLYPVAWDLRLLDLHARGGQSMNRLFQEILNDPRVVDATLDELATRLSQRSIERMTDSLFRVVREGFGDYVEYDRLRGGLIPDIGDPETAGAILTQNLQVLRSWVDSAVVAYKASPVDGYVMVDLESRGYAGADLVGFTIAEDRRADGVLRLDQNLNGVLDDEDPAVPLRRDPTEPERLMLDRPIPLFPGWKVDSGIPLPGHTAYRVFLTGGGSALNPRPLLSNRHTGQVTSVLDWPAGTVIRPGTGWHPWRYPVLRSRHIRLSGTVHLRETLRTTPADTLVIDPGTTIRLDPDVSILARGLVLAQGVPTAPIRLVPAHPTLPWGAFAIQGVGGDGSRIEHTEFVGGGGATVDRVEYTGMVNVYRVNGVLFEGIVIRDNRRSDDGLRVLHGREVVIRRSRFLRTNSDAVDLDYSDGTIMENLFETTGGDAIDLMASTPVILDNRIHGAGDKGISIGEASAPFVFGNLIENTATGVEVKDDSRPVLLHNEIRKNGVGLRESRKSWRYGRGPSSIIALTLFTDNGLAWERDSSATTVVVESPGLEATPGSAPRRAELSWLYDRFGIGWPPGSEGDGDPTPGRVENWTSRASVEPLGGQQFEEGFHAPTAGWTAIGDGTKISEVGRRLVIETERRLGEVTIPVEIDLTNNAAGGTLVLIGAGRDLDSVTVSLRSADRTVEHSFRPLGDLTRPMMRTFVIPPGRYQALRLVLRPTPGLSHTQTSTGLSVLGAGRFDLLRWEVYSLP